MNMDIAGQPISNSSISNDNLTWLENVTRPPISDEYPKTDKNQVYEIHAWENIAPSIYCAFIAIFSVLLNGIVIYLTKKHHQFHRRANMYIRAAFAVVDMLFGFLASMHYLINLNMDNIPEWVTCTGGNISIALFFSTLVFTGVIALERYHFFCKPLSYQRFFNRKSINILSIGVLLVPQLYVHLKALTEKRKLQPLYLMCTSSNQAIHNKINLLIFVLPVIVMSSFSVYKIKMLMRNITQYPATSIQQHTNAENKLKQKALRKGIRYA